MRALNRYQAVYQDSCSDSQIIIDDTTHTLDFFKKIAQSILDDMVKDPSEFTLISVSKLYVVKQGASNENTFSM